MAITININTITVTTITTNITIITVLIIIIVHSLAGERMHGLPNVSQEELKEEQHDVREHHDDDEIFDSFPSD